MSTEHPDVPSSDAEDEDDSGISEIGIGGFLGALLRFLGKFQLPAIAVGNRDLYRVMIEGSGFELPVKGSGPDDPNPNGFYTTRYVSARSRMEAEALAKAHVLKDWQGLSLFDHLTGTDQPRMSVCESAAIEGWFRRKGMGFTFYSDEKSSGAAEAT